MTSIPPGTRRGVTLAERVPILDRRWCRTLRWTVAVSGTAALVYSLAAGFGASSSVLLLGSLVSLSWSHLASRRQMEGIASILQVQYVILLIWSLIVFVQDY